MRGVLLAALYLSSATHLSAQPVTSEYDRAVAARHAGDNARALQLLSELVQREPANADAQLQLGLTLLSMGRLDEAEARFRRTLEIAPRYADARIGLARAAQRRGDNSAALSELEMIGAGNAEADALRLQLRGAAAADLSSNWRWQVSLDGSYSFVEGPPSDWKESSIRIAHRIKPETVVIASLEATRRFGLQDIYSEIRIDRRLPQGNRIYVLFGGTPEADYRPKWQLGFGGGAMVRSGGDATILTLDARQARYGDDYIQSVDPGIEQYLNDGKIWLTGRWINIFDENGTRRSGWLARGDTLATPKLRVFAGAADAPDISEGRVVDTFSIFGGASYELNSRATVSAAIASDDRETGFDRFQLSLGTSFRF